MTQHDELIDGSRKVSCISSNKINSKNYEKGSKSLQFFAAIAASLSVMASGAMVIWSSPILLMLQEDPANKENPLGRPINEEEASWIVSLPTVGTLFGSFFPGYLADKWGRRTILLFSTIPSLLSWLLIGLGKNIEVLYVSRFITGLSISASFGVLPMYIGEIAEPSIRGILNSFFQISITIGLLWANCIGPYVSYIHYCIACAALPIAFLVFFFTMPESPYYLVAKGRKEDAIKVLAKLRGKSREFVEKEADKIEEAVREAYTRKATISDLFKVKANLKALILTCALIIFQQMSGDTVVVVYSRMVFASAGNFVLSSSVETIIVNLVQLGGSFVNPLIVDRLGRRFLLIMSGIGTTLSLGLLGLFFYLKDATKIDVSNLGWLPIFSMVAYMTTYSVGLGPLPWTVMSELFSQEVKAKASTIVVFTCWFLSFMISKYFMQLAMAYGQYIAFWLFSIFCILSVVFTVFCLPETKGKSLQEIQDQLNGKRN